jgi:hypothetical protein
MAEEINSAIEESITGEMTADEAAASLGLATRLSEDLLMAQNPNVGELEPSEPQVEEDQLEEEAEEEVDIEQLVADEVAKVKVKLEAEMDRELRLIRKQLINSDAKEEGEQDNS